MNLKFEADKGIIVPDGTKVCEIIGPISSLKFNFLLEEQSLAKGILEPDQQSFIHVHPIISHLTYVLSGQLTVKMKDKVSDEMYEIVVDEGQTVLTQPETLFQLLNNSEKKCEVLYIVSPGFIYEVENDEVLYNDQIVLENKTWEKLKEESWEIPALQDLEIINENRKKSLERLKNKLNNKR